MPSKYQLRLAAMSDEEVQAEKDHFEAELDRLSENRGNEVFFKSNSLRSAWEELEKRKKKE